jgi:hypothetical protein
LITGGIAFAEARTGNPQTASGFYLIPGIREDGIIIA